MSVHPLTSAAQRCQVYVSLHSVQGSPFASSHWPVWPLSVWPSCAVPRMDGSLRFVGNSALAAPTTARARMLVSARTRTRKATRLDRYDIGNLISGGRPRKTPVSADMSGAGSGREDSTTFNQV